MHILFLDIASHEGLLACSTEKDILAYRRVDHRISDHELMMIFEGCVKEVAWTLKDMTHLACVIGPGGFTSLRVAVSFINTLSWALKIPSCGIHVSTLYAARAPITYTVSPIPYIWLHSTKKHELFVRGFGDFAAKWPEPILMTIDEALTMIPKDTIWCGELIAEHQDAFRRLLSLPCSLQPTLAILPQFLAHQPYSSQILEPWYGRGW